MHGVNDFNRRIARIACSENDFEAGCRVLGIVLGKPFVAAAPLLLLLACCIPLDFLTSYLSNAYIAWSMERGVLMCVVVAAGSNVVLNLATIPRYGAMAAAIRGVFVAHRMPVTPDCRV